MTASLSILYITRERESSRGRLCFYENMTSPRFLEDEGPKFLTVLSSNSRQQSETISDPLPSDTQSALELG